MQDPADDVFEIVPSDASNLPSVARAVSFEATGAFHFVTAAGTEITISGLAAGVIHPFRVKKVFATGTTASGIFGWL